MLPLVFATLFMALTTTVWARPMPSPSGNVGFQQEELNWYNEYRADHGLPAASILDCANQLASSVDWIQQAQVALANGDINQNDVTTKGREFCPDMPNASFHMIVSPSFDRGKIAFEPLMERGPGDLAAWTQVGFGVEVGTGASSSNMYSWSIVLVKP
ncbi:hypothetical protein THASP1DRAFT_32495 [Thamnocephalis sphaerospora]|uniref:SCP domain-containing protein n=1 Tax=Thamnocephalis sphaerospora TaxID=78915 RepID=A0A4P9XIV5_9FUNG|nr:hypothetical protein THASP1DRAFT_32495 [Thamnocephalis sphaerospora]|eukprot:RKP05663.1 hypothetical protein THASP1DRAFT_32495 [Thamnocephalis sphaerospora]